MKPDQVQLPEVEGMSHRMVDVGGVRMHVAEAGSGPPVLLLHGWPQHWYAWRRVAPLLSGERRVICPDLRGFGWSDAPPGAYDKATLAQDVIGLLDALGLERVDLIAHDWGAWIGFILCLEHPERFAHYLALNMYTPWPDPPSPRAIPVLARLWYQVALATPILGQALIRRTSFVRRLITAGAVHPAWTDDELEAFTAPLRSPARAEASVHLYRTFLLRELPKFLGGQFRDRRLTVPTLLLHGTRDLAIDHRALGEWRSHADQMDVELCDDSGHFIAEELPELVAGRARALFGASQRPETRPVS
ncbi:MAG TPA: alpha/beta fold hydrolase [Solirubrobacteraceae bacterium]|jgi:pimeloyl-ACP methyl ester carboxylesterase|nr:alpha/beta fold hydrolase [Solirubrobacteraceae bacterium]